MMFKLAGYLTSTILMTAAFAMRWRTTTESLTLQ